MMNSKKIKNLYVGSGYIRVSNLPAYMEVEPFLIFEKKSNKFKVVAPKECNIDQGYFKIRHRFSTYYKTYMQKHNLTSSSRLDLEEICKLQAIKSKAIKDSLELEELK